MDLRLSTPAFPLCITNGVNTAEGHRDFQAQPKHLQHLPFIAISPRDSSNLD